MDGMALLGAWLMLFMLFSKKQNYMKKIRRRSDEYFG
jgi:hypothetical protein